MCLKDRPCLEPNAAGIDVGAREIYVAVPPDRDEHQVRIFQTFTEDLQAMAQWLKACGITTAAIRTKLAASVPSFLLPRRFVADESWKKATTGGGRYLGFFREYEPELLAILTHNQIIILGEPGAGKSTAGQAIIQHGQDFFRVRHHVHHLREV